jgi:hypothetical protein
MTLNVTDGDEIRQKKKKATAPPSETAKEPENSAQH